MSNSGNNFLSENADSDDNSETHDNEGSDDYYQPISAVDDDDSEEDGFPNGDSTPSRPAAQDLCNGYLEGGGGGGMDLKEEDNGSSTEEDEEERAAASESAMWRAFREDENRRHSPLPRENATRIMDAMRGISLPGFSPDWANRVPEPRWIDTLARLRRQPPPPSATATAAPTVTRN